MGVINVRPSSLAIAWCEPYFGNPMSFATGSHSIRRLCAIVCVLVCALALPRLAGAQTCEWRSARGAAVVVQTRVFANQWLRVRTTEPVVASVGANGATHAVAQSPIRFEGELGDRSRPAFVGGAHALGGVLDAQRGVQPTVVRAVSNRNAAIVFSTENGSEIEGITVACAALALPRLRARDDMEPENSASDAARDTHSHATMSSLQFDLCDSPRCTSRVHVKQREPESEFFTVLALRPDFVRVELQSSGLRLRGWVPHSQVVIVPPSNDQIGETFAFGGLGLRGTGRGGGAPLSATFYIGRARFHVGALLTLSKNGIEAPWAEIVAPVVGRVSGDTAEPTIGVDELPGVSFEDDHGNNMLTAYPDPQDHVITVSTRVESLDLLREP